MDEEWLNTEGENGRVFGFCNELKQTRFWFEHWAQGKMLGIEMCQANSLKEAVCLMSDQFKGVFLLVDRQTEIQRNRENWRRFESVSGDF